MKKITICTLALLMLLTALLIFSCTPAQQNTNQTQNTNTPAANNSGNSAEVASLASDPCSAATITARLTDVDAKLKEWIEDKGSLEDQYPNYFNFTLRVSPTGDSIYMYIDGALGGKDQAGDLASIIKRVMKKERTCVQRVIFLKPGTLKSGAALTDDMGFDWFNCDDPKVPCPGGRCLDSCDSGNTNTVSGPKPSSTANSNAAPSSNSNKGNANH